MRIEGQSMLADIIAALLIFTVLGGSLMWMWSNNISDLENQIIENEMKQTAERTLDTLIRSGGQPADWEEDVNSPDAIGLAKRDRVLDEEKLNQFVWRAGTLDRGLVALWHFDEGTGNTTEDSSTNTNDGSLQPVGLEPTWQGTGCQSGSCLLFDGDDDYVNVLDDPSLNITGDITISLWLKTVELGSNDAYFQMDYTTNTGILVYSITNNVPVIIFGNGTGIGSASADSAISQDTWHHIVGLREGDTIKIYMDGIEQTNAGTISGPTFFNGGITTNIGKWGSSYQFNGQIDEVRVYNRALDESEITAMQQWTPTFERQRLLIAGNDYYFRLTDPETGSTLTNSYSDLIEAGIDPSGIAGSNLMQTAVRRTVTYKGGAVIAELILYRIL